MAKIFNFESKQLQNNNAVTKVDALSADICLIFLSSHTPPILPKAESCYQHCHYIGIFDGGYIWSHFNPEEFLSRNGSFIQKYFFFKEKSFLVIVHL